MPAVIEDTTALTTVESEASKQTLVITTLYDLMAALQRQVEPRQDDVVITAVAQLCNTGRLRFFNLSGALVHE